MVSEVGERGGVLARLECAEVDGERGGEDASDELDELDEYGEKSMGGVGVTGIRKWRGRWACAGEMA